MDLPRCLELWVRNGWNSVTLDGKNTLLSQVTILAGISSAMQALRRRGTNLAKSCFNPP